MMDPFNPRNEKVAKYWETPELVTDVSRVAFSSSQDHGIMLKAPFEPQRILPFEILARSSFTGNLDAIDEDERSFARFYPDREDQEVEVCFGEKVFNFPWYVFNKFEPLALRIQMLFRRTQRLDHTTNVRVLPCVGDSKFLQETAYRLHPIVKVHVTKEELERYDEVGHTDLASKYPLSDPPMFETAEEAQTKLKEITSDAVTLILNQRAIDAQRDARLAEAGDDNPWQGLSPPRKGRGRGRK